MVQQKTHYRIIVETIIILLISKFIPLNNIDSYGSWIIYGFIVFLISSMITLSINLICFKNDFKEVIKFIKRSKRH